MATLIGMPASPNCKEEIEVFANQNRKILEIFKKHLEIHENGSGNYLPVIRELVHYMSRAFHEENMIMMQNHYPKFLEHARAHEKFTQRVEEFLKNYEDGDSNLGFKIFTFLKDWAREHTSKLDVECASYLCKLASGQESDESFEEPVFQDSFLAFALAR